MVPMKLFAGWEQRHADIENGCVGTSGEGAGWGKERVALKYIHRAVLSHCSCVRLFATPIDLTHQAPLSMRFSRQEYWSGLPRPSPGDLPDPGVKPTSPEAPTLQADSLRLIHQGSPEIYRPPCVK